MGYVALAGTVISAGVQLYAASQKPDMPSYPKIPPMNVQKIKTQAERAEQNKYDMAKADFKKRFPQLAAAQVYEQNEVNSMIGGDVSGLTKGTLASSGLAPVKTGTPTQTSRDMGRKVLEKTTEDFSNLNTQIASNPAVSTKLSGRDLAMLLANKNLQANQQAINLWQADVAQHNADTASSMRVAQAAGTAVGEIAPAAVNIYNPNPLSWRSYSSSDRPLSDVGPGPSDVTTTGYYT